MNKAGKLHVYYGEGKGKTTAALGMALRAAGQGLSVVIVQFLKNTPCGELVQLARLPEITVLRGQEGSRFAFQMSEAEKTASRQIHNDNLRQALALVAEGRCDLLILDEALDACQLGLLDEDLLKEALFGQPPALERVITGHKAIAWIVEAADYVTEMVKHKHPYDQGLKARKGIEF